MKLEIPHFATEREEADWWFQNQDVAAELLEEEYGLPDPAYVTVDLLGEDALLIRKLAADKGVEPHIYAAGVLHEALHRNGAA